MYKCEICGRKFKTLRSLIIHIPNAHHINIEAYYCLAFDKEPNICPVCGKETAFKSYRDGYREFCSPRCASVGTVQKRREFFTEKYGVDHPMKSEKVKLKQKTVIRRKYGVDSPSQSYAIRLKQKETLKKNYGVENPSHSEEIKQKRQETFKKRFGVSNPNKNRKVREKLERTVKERYGVTCVFANPEIKEKIHKKTIEEAYKHISNRLEYCELLTPLDEYKSVSKQRLRVKCKSCGNEFEAFFGGGGEPRCKKCYGDKTKIERFVADILDENGVNYYFGFRGYKPFEYDFVLPDYSIAIETNGIYWHQQQITSNLYDNPKRYHLDKTARLASIGIQLLHFFEDEVKSKPDIVKDMILAKVGSLKTLCGARQTTIKCITAKEANTFLDKNHILGMVRGRCLYYGAYYKYQLVSVMTFKVGNAAHKNDKHLELDRFCVLLGYNIPGIASKLFKYVVNDTNAYKVITYADRRFSVGGLYEKLGFCLDSITPPNYFYIVKARRVHRYNYRKSELPKKLEYFDPNLTEYENMLLNGYDRIWDCGHLKFVWTR